MAGRGHLTVNYTGTQSFIPNQFHLLAQKLEYLVVLKLFNQIFKSFEGETLFIGAFINLSSIVLLLSPKIPGHYTNEFKF